MPPLTRPRPGTYWFATDGRTQVVQVLPDRRYTKKVLVGTLNQIANPLQEVLTLEQFHEAFEVQPRIDESWLNRMSVWRRLDDTSLGLENLIVIDRIADGGGVHTYRIDPNGELVPRQGSLYGDFGGGPSAYNFMRQCARIWAPTDSLLQPSDPNSEDELFPRVLYQWGLTSEPPAPKPKKRKPRKKASPKPKPVRRSAWDRLLDDD